MANENQNIIGAGRESAHRAPKEKPLVLDVCCGSRMFWFNRSDSRCIYVDKRQEHVFAKDCSVKNGEREIVVAPDVKADFIMLPFCNNIFAHVVFDPPHIQRNGDTSWLLKKYGVLRGEWREMIRKGFSECFRVLRPYGILVFKWNEIEVPLREILKLTPERPLYGHRTGKQVKTHWVAFIKQEPPVLGEDNPALNTMEICHTAPNSQSDAIALH
jgi:SAM-dependent methyltransferase